MAKCQCSSYIIIILTLFGTLQLYGVYCKRVKRIISGTPVGCGYLPQVVSLRNAVSKQHLCGATLLSPTWAVTAAHCITRYSATPGLYELHLKNWCGTKPSATVQEVVVHPEYDKLTRAHDIALLKISLNMNDTSWINEDILPRAMFGLSGTCTVLGYGTTDAAKLELSDELVAAEVRVVSLDECKQKLHYLSPSYDSGLMCGVGGESDSCQGDSGGPLLCDGELSGVISHGVGCGIRGMPAVFAHVGSHITWLRTYVP